MAVELSCPVLQIVGFQNSGKTTLMEKLISALSQQGYRVASIKHHGHGGKPSVSPAARKDSARHQHAGAFLSGVEGAGELHLTVEKDFWSLKDLLKLYGQFSPDIILVEGYKREPFPKVALLRSKDDESLLELDNIAAVISWVPQAQPKNSSGFLIEEDDRYIPWLINYVRDWNGKQII